MGGCIVCQSCVVGIGSYQHLIALLMMIFRLESHVDLLERLFFWVGVAGHYSVIRAVDTQCYRRLPRCRPGYGWLVRCFRRLASAVQDASSDGVEELALRNPLLLMQALAGNYTMSQQDLAGDVVQALLSEYHVIDKVAYLSPSIAVRRDAVQILYLLWGVSDTVADFIWSRHLLAYVRGLIFALGNDNVERFNRVPPGRTGFLQILDVFCWRLRLLVSFYCSMLLRTDVFRCCLFELVIQVLTCTCCWRGKSRQPAATGPILCLLDFWLRITPYWRMIEHGSWKMLVSLVILGGSLLMNSRVCFIVPCTCLDLCSYSCVFSSEAVISSCSVIFASALFFSRQVCVRESPPGH